MNMETIITVPGARDQAIPQTYLAAFKYRSRDAAEAWAYSSAGPMLNTHTRPLRGFVVSREWVIRYVANLLQGDQGVLEEYLTEVLLHRPLGRRPEMVNANLPCKTVIRTVLRLARRYGAPVAEQLGLALQGQLR